MNFLLAFVVDPVSFVSCSSTNSRPTRSGSKGLRKLRVAASGRGKRGGARVIYYWFVSPEVITLCRIYRKNERENLPESEIQQIAKELGL